MVNKLQKSYPKRSKASLTLCGALGCLCWFLTAEAWGQPSSQILKVSEHKRLEASICPDSMNRLAVSNDRITQVFGDEGTFESQNDEGTGQVFLKPTAENGTKR